MAPADEEPARPPHHEAAPASVPSAPPIASSTPPPAAAAAASSSAPASSSASSASPPPPAPTAAPPAPTQASPAPRPPAAPPSPDASLAASAVVASASQPQKNGDDGDDAGSELETDNMSTHSAALSAAHHGLALSYPASTAASPSVYLASSNMPSGQYVPAPMSLPSMRTMDSMPQQPVSQPPAPHHTMAMAMTTPLAPVSGAPLFYPHHAMALPSNYSLAHDAMSRFPLPHDPRILGSRGPKKEIKRRTKTGCLTCRKRRIKCDETHPTCNNCKKSKRECLGYDPIFRQQGGGGPTISHIQPAPASQPTVSSSLPSSTSLHSAPAPAPRLANPYGNQPAVLPSAYASTPATTTASYSPPATATAPVIKTEPGYDHLIKAEPSDSVLRHLPLAPPADNSKAPDPRPASLPDASPQPTGAKRMKIHEIIDLLGPPPPPQQISHTEETFNEVTMIYHEMYAGGLSAFFESTWYYFIESGKMTFPKDTNLIEHLASFLKILEAVKANDHTQMAYSGALETRIVWELACIVYQVPDRTNNAMRTAMPLEGDATELRNRLRVVEALLCGEYLAANPLAPPVMDNDQHKMRQFDFWYSLAEFVRRRDNPGSPEAVKAREDMLARMRHLLDGRENRDVLYSIAVMRELAPKFEPGYAGTIPQHLDESDPKNRLAVASKFILDEAQVTGGTTNVVRRFSDIALRAFVNPGANVAERT
ncbi:fungal zn(2)-Cys(6) binuclear cluster domain-containing protein [Hirsutella rhossiliensis]|uniref:Fungal zn(2)-Cys(6) binuclear cluster domain-containing protein n=1 Tax=Hirsutella rhossiliensis TaxID=111463 RepID=A0A9P8MWD6_9HYPO|nr:fungal zn(2)-Cys(6) binuclear cluster domain-containing protein [Hirsutella rhossiliensis]KAH0963313.1 fungal zn(2)-Cys(6) binuclear cluster domain-containing protein [Hirsutella rhossiliensis]